MYRSRRAAATNRSHHWHGASSVPTFSRKGTGRTAPRNSRAHLRGSPSESARQAASGGNRHATHRFADAARARNVAGPSYPLPSSHGRSSRPTVRIRGTIESVDGAMLMIKSREGADMKVRMTDNVAVFGVAKTELSEIERELLHRCHRDAPSPTAPRRRSRCTFFRKTSRAAQAEGFRPSRTRARRVHDQRHGGRDGQGHRRPEHPS